MRASFFFLFPIAFLPLIACTTTAPTGTDDEDSDDDAIDPDADEDGDGLSNGEEDELGTAYDEEDSDDDGFNDGDEVEAGTNPLYEWSHTFEEGDYLIGNCPVPPDEENAGPSSKKLGYQEGDIMANVAVGGIDSFGQEVTLYSFCGNYTLVTLSAEWCGPCQDMAAVMAEETEDIRENVENFTFYEFLYQDNAYETSDEAVLKRWRRKFGLDGIPVVAPEDQTDDAVGWLMQSNAIPSTTLVAPDMTVIWAYPQHEDEYYLIGAKAIKDAIRAHRDADEE